MLGICHHPHHGNGASAPKYFKIETLTGSKIYVTLLSVNALTRMKDGTYK